MERKKDYTPSSRPAPPAKKGRAVAVAIQGSTTHTSPLFETPLPLQPKVIASGKGSVAEDILKLAYENNVKVREDGPLAEILAALDLETPIPAEAIIAVAEILAKVYDYNNALTLGANNDPNTLKPS